MARDGNTLSPVIRRAWDKGNLQTLTKNSPAKATGAHISIVGHITRDELRRYLDRTEVGNGFGNRFLWVCVKRSKCLPEGGRIHTVDFGDIHRRLVEAISFASKRRELHKDDEAKEIWASIYPELSEGVPGLFGALTSRAEAQVMRIAAIYALLDRRDVIDKQHLLAALAVWDYCKDSVRHVFGDALGDPDADAILSALRSKANGMTRSQIRELFGRHRSSDRIQAALALLQEHKLARFTEEQTDGRPARRWFAARR